MRKAKILNRLGGCTGLSESSLGICHLVGFACAKYHPGLCIPFIHSIISNECQQTLTVLGSFLVILCRLPEKGRKVMEEIVKEMKERDREEMGT